MVGTTTTVGATGVGGVLLSTLLMGSTPAEFDTLELPTTSVNVDNSILSTWMSEQVETFTNEPLSSECQFYDFSRRYDADFCDAFTISRMQGGTVNVALERALRCAAKANVECVLSPEIGLAIPAAFVAAPEEPSGIKVYIAPRVLPLPNAVNATQQHVRVSVPSDTFQTRTILMNNTLRLEYMTQKKKIIIETITGDDAHCVNLLRAAYEASCWARLDG